MKNIVISVVFAAAAASAQAAADKVREFRYEDGANVLPSYRTWEFSVEEPGLYVFDIAPDDGKTAPAVREWLDGVQIGYVLNSADWKAKTARTLGRLRRFRWLEKGKYRYDLYLNVGGYNWNDDMERAMNEKRIRVRCERLGGSQLVATVNGRDARSPSADAPVVGFWMDGKDPDSMARVMGEPLVVAACAAPQGNDGRARSPSAPHFTMEVLRASASPREPIWSQTLAIGETPVRFEYPCDKEGAFTYVIKNDKDEVVEGPWAFAVTDIWGNENPVNLVNPVKTISVPPRDPILVDRVDCTESAGGPHLFREGGKSEIIDTPDGAYRRSGPQGYKDVFRRQNPDGSWSPAEPGEKGAQRKRFHDWFAYTLKVEHPGRSHALVVRVPNDMRHLTHVVAYDRRTRLLNAWGIDSGDAPAAGPWSEMKIPVWPNTDAIDVMVISTDNAVNTHIPHPNRRGAVASLSLLEYPDGFPALEAPACGWNFAHNFGWKGEQINLGPHERTMPRLSGKALKAALAGAGKPNVKGPAYSWEDFLETWERTFELEAWRGGTTLMYPVYTYDMVTFQGPAQKLIPAGYDRYTHQCAGMEPVDPFDRDEFALMLQRAQKHGVRLVADFMIQRTGSQVVSAWCKRYGMGGATNGFYLVASADGKPYRPAPCVYSGMPNPAHQAARAVQIEFCREFGRRYGRYESFAGIRNRFWRGWPSSFSPWFYSEATGFDDFTVGEFSKATGIDLPPVGNDEAAFDARKKRIREEYGREWNDWRTKVCLSLQEEMLAAMREGAPQARFYNDSSPDDYDAACGLDPAVFAERRDLGFSRDQTSVRGPGVEINHLDPIHFAKFWVHRPEDAAGLLPPPTGLCCNSSYRCVPYNLEPAALALAENRLDHIWAGGNWCLPPLDDALRAFVRAYRAIPDRTDWRRAPIGNVQLCNCENMEICKYENANVATRNCSQITNASLNSPTRPLTNSQLSTCSTRLNSPVAVWWAKDGGDVLFFAVNRTDASRRVVLTFDKEPSALVDCVTGNPVNPVNPVKKTQGEISLAPFMPGVFRAKGAGSLVGFEVPVEPEETAQIEKDFAFIASAANNVAITSAVEIGQGVGETYFAPAGALGKRDCRWSFSELFSPMREAHDAGDFHSLRALVADFKMNHLWWFEAFGWPDDFCVRRNVGRLPLVGFLRQGKRTEMWFGDTNGVFTANFSEKFPQCKKDFVCAPKGIALDILRHGQPGGFRQLELSALFGGGYGAIRVDD